MAGLRKIRYKYLWKNKGFLAASNVKRCRYAHQVTLVALVTLAKRAHQSTKDQSYDSWKTALKDSSTNAKYWFTIIELEIKLFMFVRSIREGNFELFVQSVEELIPWSFSLDHVNYARWLPVFLCDLKALPKEQTVFKEFCQGNFTINKTGHAFPNMGVDQAHEQNNKCVKIDGGAIGILESEQALLEWAVSGPIVTNMLGEVFDTANENDEYRYHHEDTDHFERTFPGDKAKLIAAFEDLGNPFSASKTYLINVFSRVVIGEEGTNSVKNAENLGNAPSAVFITERLIDGTASLYDNIKQNRLQLCDSKKAVKASKAKKDVKLLKDDCRLFSDVRQELVTFFAHENHPFPASLSEHGSLSTHSKSDFVNCIKALYEPEYEPPITDALIVDGAAMVHMNYPEQSIKTFGQYCDTQLVSKVTFMSAKVSHLDIVFDVYRKTTMKQDT